MLKYFLFSMVAFTSIHTNAIHSYTQRHAGNIVLLSVFALQHSIMARQGFKNWRIKIIPASIERSTYVLLASLALLLLLSKWQSFTAVIGQAHSTIMQYALTILFFAGWAIVLVSTFMINHFDLLVLNKFSIVLKINRQNIFRSKQTDFSASFAILLCWASWLRFGQRR